MGELTLANFHLIRFGHSIQLDDSFAPKRGSSLEETLTKANRIQLVCQGMVFNSIPQIVCIKYHNQLICHKIAGAITRLSQVPLNLW